MKKLSLLILTCCLLIAAPGDVRTSLTLEWDDDNPPEVEVTSYRLYEVVSGSFVQVAEVAAPIKTVTIPNTTPGRRTFVVTAVNRDSESLASNEARTLPQGQAPKNNRLAP